MIDEENYQIVKSLTIYFFLVSVIVFYTSFNKQTELPIIVFLMCLTLGLAVNNDNPNTNTILFLITSGLILKFYYEKNILKRIKRVEEPTKVEEPVEETDLDSIKAIIKKSKPRRKKADPFSHVLKK